MNQRPLPLLYLGSQSPRREQLLSSLGLSFRVLVPSTEEVETASDATIEKVTLHNSRNKAQSVLPKVSGDAIVIGADTLVVLDDVALTKPKDRADAQSILEKLSGRTHRVVTGLTMMSPKWGARGAVDSSFVTFRKLSPVEISHYLDTKEPYDKAGAYAVQGMGALFIEKIEGSYTNVMGLPIELLLKELAALTSIPVHGWFL